MLVVGVLLLVGGLVGAAGLWSAADARHDDNLATFARAPSGCATTLDFERTGDFTLYVETTGRIDDPDGDCAAETEYDRDDVPDVGLILTDADEQPVEIATGGDTTYDNGTFVGEAVGVVRIDEPGEHVLTVPGSGAAFAVAVGGPPDEGVALLRWGAVALAVVALAGGVTLLVLGSRRPPAAAPAPATAVAPGWPTSPPGFPTPPPTTGASGPPMAAPGAPPHQPPSSPSGPPGWQPPSWGPPSV
jgi:hypothetical protein